VRRRRIFPDLSTVSTAIRRRVQYNETVGGLSLAGVRIMYWKHIPYAVRAKDDAGQVSRSLPQAFQEAIDALAMNVGAAAAEDYQAGFRWGPTEEAPGSAAAAADAAVAAIVAAWPEDRLKAAARGEDEAR